MAFGEIGEAPKDWKEFWTILIATSLPPLVGILIGIGMIHGMEKQRKFVLEAERKIERIYNKYDSNGDGDLSYSEGMKMIRDFGITDEYPTKHLDFSLSPYTYNNAKNVALEVRSYRTTFKRAYPLTLKDLEEKLQGN